MVAQSYAKKHPTLTLWIGALWAAINLLLVLGVVLFVLFSLLNQAPQAGEPFSSPPQAQYWVMWVAAVAMVALVIITMPNPECYGGDARFDVLPAVLRWPLKVGTWIGTVSIVICNLFVVFGTVGGGDAPVQNMRVSLSLTSVVGLGLSYVLSLGMQLPASFGLVVLWGGAFVLLVVRGTLGLFRWLPSSWLKPKRMGRREPVR